MDYHESLIILTPHQIIIIVVHVTMTIKIYSDSEVWMHKTHTKFRQSPHQHVTQRLLISKCSRIWDIFLSFQDPNKALSGNFFLLKQEEATETIISEYAVF